MTIKIKVYGRKIWAKTHGRRGKSLYSEQKPPTNFKWGGKNVTAYFAKKMNELK